MKSKEVKKELLENFKLYDALVDKVDALRKQTLNLMTDISDKDIKGEDVTDLLLDYKMTLMDSMLVNDDIIKSITKLSVLYKLCKSLEIDIDLDDSDLRRLVNVVNQENSFYILHRGKLAERDNIVSEKIKEKLKESPKEELNSYLINLRKSPLYNERKIKSEDNTEKETDTKENTEENNKKGTD